MGVFDYELPTQSVAQFYMFLEEGKILAVGDFKINGETVSYTFEEPLIFLSTNDDFINCFNFFEQKNVDIIANGGIGATCADKDVPPPSF